ncbi:hypothetical protein BT96DRAFT_919284 [Gymnopus androsaceus JB14]|uniref:Uncharacterized protein n=1 Tax=Gymnopus androsaceus JB14 TaxID=1447944 RepID=A0A6A4HW35_9AGAR|nr:hypothetical protein BT96DRAFT_919284 [Gymnopus androsaceus JB14]
MDFEETARYQIQGPDADKEWAALYPYGGIIHLGSSPTPYTPSMFHQLGCLDIVRKEIIHVQGSPVKIKPSQLADHCSNYLRQMMLCRSDIALEYCVGKPHVDVFPETYTCQDWRRLYEELEKNHRESVESGLFSP